MTTTMATTRSEQQKRISIAAKATEMSSAETETERTSSMEETWNEDDIDNIAFVDLDAAEATAISNKSGAGATMAAPNEQRREAIFRWQMPS